MRLKKVGSCRLLTKFSEVLPLKRSQARSRGQGSCVLEVFVDCRDHVPDWSREEMGFILDRSRASHKTWSRGW